jgi:hypothetical protein
MVILERISASKKLVVVKALEADFWLRLMADHTKFIAARIDPSERSLMNVDQGYETEFDNLSMQARDYVSFLAHRPIELPAFDRFLQDSRVATTRLRDFKQALYDMISANRMLSTLPAAMADHVRREADHFLLMLSLMEKGVIKVEKDVVAFQENYSPVVEEVFEEELGDELLDTVDLMGPEREPKPKFKPQAYEAIDDLELDYTPGSGREKTLSYENPTTAKWAAGESAKQPIVPDSTEKQESEVVVSAKIVAAEKAAIPSKPANEPKKQGKYKWGGNWPRQLGKLIK